MGKSIGTRGEDLFQNLVTTATNPIEDRIPFSSINDSNLQLLFRANTYKIIIIMKISLIVFVFIIKIRDGLSKTTLIPNLLQL